MASLWERFLDFFGLGAQEPNKEHELKVPPPRGAPRPEQKDAPPPAFVKHYSATGVFALTPAELRRRMHTARIPRWASLNLRPTETDAMVDRRLVDDGFLPAAELDRIRTIAREWHENRAIASQVARADLASAQAAIDAARAQKAAIKAQKKAESAARRASVRQGIDERKRTDIVFVGRGFSGSLNDRRANVEALTARELPLLSTPAELAEVLGIPVPRLRWLAFHHPAPRLSHYTLFEVRKRSGGTRLLMAPKRDLSAAQRWILDTILSRLPSHPSAHGFVTGRSTVTHALPHVGRDVVVTLDMKDFFPGITFPRVRGLFAAIGYSPAVATLLAMICTEPPRRKMIYDGTTYFVAVGDRGLPQGACTSPALSNAIARKLDQRLTGLASAMGAAYSRYADDLAFSFPPGHREEIGRLKARVQRLLHEEGFVPHPEKGAVRRKGRRQRITGIVVNQKPTLPREEVRLLRAILHNANKTGLEAQNRDNHPQFAAWLRGKIAYLQMIDPDKAAPMLAALDRLTATG